MDTTLYTDGHGIKVTSSELITGTKSYRIDGIVHARINLLKATTAPAIIFLLAGIAFIATGIMHLYNNIPLQPFYVSNILLTANRLALIAGAFLFVAGLVWSITLHDKYAVHIITAAGDKDLIISRKKDYIRQIVSALQKALDNKYKFLITG